MSLLHLLTQTTDRTKVRDKFQLIFIVRHAPLIHVHVYKPDCMLCTIILIEGQSNKAANISGT